jgi:hypothetical protein
LLVVAGAVLAPVAAHAQEQRPPDPYYDCPYVFRGEVMFRGTLAEQARVVRGALVGTARQPSCHPYPQSDRIVPVYRLGDASPRLVLVGENAERSVYLRLGSLPQLPRHPAHRVIYGARSRPDLRAGLRCGAARRVSGRLVDEVAGGGPLELRRGQRTVRVEVEARTTVRGGRRIAGQPVLRRGDRLSGSVRTCRAGSFRRVIASRLRLAR